MCCRRAASPIVRPRHAIKPTFKDCELLGSCAGFGTLSSQSGSDARLTGPPDPLIGGPSFVRAPALSARAMLYFVIKAALSGLIVAAVSEIARRSPGWGGLLASLPLTSLLAMIWLWRDSHDGERVAELAGSAFWFILPSLPMFLVLPWLIRSGMWFWLSLSIVVVGTLALYAAWFWAAPRMGIKL